MIFLTQEADLHTNKKLQAIYFYSSWQPYHNKFMCMISKMEEKYKDIEFFAIDVDQFNTQCKRFSIDSIPTVLIFKEWEEIKRINGLVLTSAFKSAFADIY